MVSRGGVLHASQPMACVERNIVHTSQDGAGSMQVAWDLQ